MNAELPPPDLRRIRAFHPPPSRSRRPTAWIVEMAVLFALVLGLDQAMRPGFELLGMTPHPFWVPVVAMAALYGLVAGLGAAMLGSVLLIWTEPALSPALADHFLQWMHFWKEPVLWLLAALALGTHREQEITRRRELEERAIAAEARSETIAAHAASLRSHVGRLEREIALGSVQEADRSENPARPPFAAPNETAT